MQYPNQVIVVIFCEYYKRQLFGIVIYGIWLSPLIQHSLTYLHHPCISHYLYLCFSLCAYEIIYAAGFCGFL